MKKTIILCSFAFLCACFSGQNKQTSESEETPRTLTTSVQDATSSAEDDPFVTRVCTLSPQDIHHRIGKAEPESVRDFFLLLPDSITLSLPLETRMLMLKHSKNNNTTIKVETCDENHNFLNLSGYEGRWEMFVKTPSNKYLEASENDHFNIPTWDILVYQESSIPECHVVRAATYFYHNGVIEEFTGALINGYQDYWLGMFLDSDKFGEEEWEKLDGYFHEKARQGILFSLPRDGKTIEMYLDRHFFDDFNDFDVPNDYFKIERTDITQ